MAPWGPTLPQPRVVYLHGGGYVGEIDANHWTVCRRFATLTPARVVVPIYPVAPDSTAARRFRRRHGDRRRRPSPKLVTPRPVTVMGDSGWRHGREPSHERCGQAGVARRASFSSRRGSTRR
jgi:acetyl esterase/lipase